MGLQYGKTLMLRPNALPLSCAAFESGIAIEIKSALKMRTILGPQSGVSYSGLLGTRDV